MSKEKKPELFIRLEQEDKDKITAAAKAEKLSVSAWSRIKLLAAAAKVQSVH